MLDPAFDFTERKCWIPPSVLRSRTLDPALFYKNETQEPARDFDLACLVPRDHDHKD